MKMNELAPLLLLYSGFIFIIFVMFRNYKTVYIYLKAITNKTPEVILGRSWGEKYSSLMTEANGNLGQAVVFLWFSILILWIISVKNSPSKGAFFKTISCFYFAFVFLSANLIGCWAVRRYLDSMTIQEIELLKQDETGERLKSMYFRWTAITFALFFGIWAYISFFKK